MAVSAHTISKGAPDLDYVLGQGHVWYTTNQEFRWTRAARNNFGRAEYNLMQGKSKIKSMDASSALHYLVMRLPH